MILENGAKKPFKGKSKLNKNCTGVLDDGAEKLLESNFDPNGSYTGVSVDGEPPVQDADDL